MPITMFMNNSEGLNLTDSPLTIKDTQATGQSYNYDYSITGAITKVLGAAALNASPDTQLQAMGLGVHHSATTDARTLIRAAGTKIQSVDISSGVCTDQTEDTSTAGTNFLSSGSAVPVVFAPFNTSVLTQLWMAGGGLSSVYAYTGSGITQNGVVLPTGVISGTVNTHTTGVWAAAGKYYYAVVFYKGSTQVIGNASLDITKTTVNTDDTVTLDLTGLTNLDTTKYTKVYIYRSAINGVSGFTTGDLIAQLTSSVTSYIDTGTYITTATNVPRVGNSILDNSPLPTGTYKTVAAFKRRLITAQGGTFYVSDLDKPESWPISNAFVVPSGGPITAVSTIGVPSEYTTGADQYACIWKENELWVFTGDSSSNWELLFVDKTGCIGQSAAVPFNGFLTWVAYNGIYLWDGKGKPSRISRPIQADFGSDGDLDKTKITQIYGAHYKASNQVIWRLSHRTKGAQQLTFKLDTRLSAKTMYSQSGQLQNPELDGVFIQDTDANAYYAICSYQPAGGMDEILFGADSSGYIYQLYNSASTAVAFNYETRALDMGIPQNNKRYLRLLAFVEKLTDNDLTLYFWADSRTRAEYQSKTSASMAPQRGTQPSLWDVGLWDIAYWDDYVPDISPIEFRFHSNENNAEGSSIKIRFEQLEANAPVRIHGFAIEWEDMGPIPVPTQQVT